MFVGGGGGGLVLNVFCVCVELGDWVSEKLSGRVQHQLCASRFITHLCSL